MDFLKQPQQKHEQPSNLKTSISVESLQRPKLTLAEGSSTAKLTTSRHTGVQVSGSSTHLSKGSLSLATNLHHIGKQLFFPVTGLTVEGFLSETTLSPRQRLSPRKAPPTDESPLLHGRKVCVNGSEIAVFLYRNKFYAVDEHCSHLGGPLHLGDIEDTLSLTTGQSTPCIICPWHKWCFDLSTGRQLDPLGREQHIQSYPVRVDSETGTISIGFASFDSSLFTDYDF